MTTKVDTLHNGQNLIQSSDALTEPQQAAKPAKTFSFDSWNNTTLLYMLLVFSAIVIFRNAWVGDDAYIGFRTVYNFANGYGLTFNINERVQSFTNPLWILIMSGLYVFTKEAYFTTIILSLICTLLAFYVLAFKVAKSNFFMPIGFALLLSSKAFIDYSTSGLENPLGHLLLVLFAYVYLKEDNTDRRLLLLSVIAALAGVNRLDNLLLYFVPMLYDFIRFFSIRRVLIMAVGFLPLIAWEVFAILYYGFPFPNTYYTKLNTAIPASEYIAQGVRYLVNSMDLDPITLLAISFAVCASITFSYKKRSLLLLPLACSVVLYVVYTVKVGGDFMSGRFLTYPFLLAVILITQLELEPRSQYALLGLTVLLVFVTPYSPIKSNQNYRIEHHGNYSANVINEGVADERAWYYHSTGFQKLSKGLFIVQLENNFSKLQPAGDSILRYEESEVMLGFNGYAAGPNVYLFHHMGLSDVLIAHLPRDLSKGQEWRVGHVWRKIPEGYQETLRTGNNVMTDPNLAQYYDKIKLIIQGKIFSWERLVTIFEMNTGKYDHLINKEYYSSQQP